MKCVSGFRRMFDGQNLGFVSRNPCCITKIIVLTKKKPVHALLQNEATRFMQ